MAPESSHSERPAFTTAIPALLAVPGTEGFPDSPWFMIADGETLADVFFGWMMSVDSCGGNEMLGLFHRFISTQDPASMPLVLIDKLQHIATQLKAGCERLTPTCTCVPTCEAVVVSPLPAPVYCQLSRGPGRKTWQGSDNWHFDRAFDTSADVLGWIIARLKEYYWHHSMLHPRAEFPVQVGGPVQTHFGPVPWILDSTPHSDHNPHTSLAVTSLPKLSTTGMVIELVHYDWPSEMKKLDLRRKWLSYLHRCAAPEALLMDFPPLSCSLLSITDEPEFNEDVAWVLWGSYRRCEIIITMLGGWKANGLSVPEEMEDDQPVRLREVNGLTVVYFALPTGARRRLLQPPRLLEMIYSDILRHRLRWLLPQKHF